MRNPSKNTIKRIMRQAVRCQAKGLNWSPVTDINVHWLYNKVGASIYRMSKGRICNMGLMGATKYVKTIPGAVTIHPHKKYIK